MKKTSLHSHHLSLGAKLVDFSGFQMPIFYKSISEEHRAVRNSAGLFDVSHMGQIYIKGNNRKLFLNKILTSDVSKLSTGSVQYSILCNHDGGIIDDLLVYCYDDYFMLIVNSNNLNKCLKWMNSNNEEDIIIEDNSSKINILAIQGPDSRKILSEIFNKKLTYLSFYSFLQKKLDNDKLTISRTGYTGELGYEIYCGNNIVGDLWDKILSFQEVVPAGLGARDLLRLEMKYCLYGNDINDFTNPFEAGLGWLVSFKKKNFIGKESLEKLKTKISKKLVCFKMIDRAIPRKGYSIMHNKNKLGEVTSGGFSSVLGYGIGMGYIKKEYSSSETEIEINIRGMTKKAIIKNGPVYKNGSLYR